VQPRERVVSVELADADPAILADLRGWVHDLLTDAAAPQQPSQKPLHPLRAGHQRPDPRCASRAVPPAPPSRAARARRDRRPQPAPRPRRSPAGLTEHQPFRAGPRSAPRLRLGPDPPPVRRQDRLGRDQPPVAVRHCRTTVTPVGQAAPGRKRHPPSAPTGPSTNGAPAALARGPWKRRAGTRRTARSRQPRGPGWCSGWPPSASAPRRRQRRQPSPSLAHVLGSVRAQE
jgi:hypothetical protein